MSKTRKLTDEQINESFEEALKNGEVTDLMGEKLERKDFIYSDEFDTTEERQFLAALVVEQIKNLQGKILTIVDATYDDKERAKYVKDVMKDAFSTQANWSFESMLTITGSLEE